MDLVFNDTDKGIIKIDPRTKFFMFLASGCLTLASFSDLGTIVFTAFLCVILALCGKPVLALKAAGVFFLTVFFRFTMDASLGAPKLIVGILSMLSTAVMFSFPMILSLIIIVKTTKISHFISAFQAMKLPIKVIVPFAVFFRFLPTVSDEWTGIRKAMAFRGISLSPAEVIKHPWRTIEYILIPMLFASINVMDELAAATMARGMDVDIKRSSYEEVKLKAIDYILICLFIALVAVSIILGNMVKGGSAI
ncbi:MAG: energy-coupling factor transporter transmembrane protein EcfT [Lachnospiraceae bacterium]|nr:energy-coupling factor transporter transmembrane protein EcfT [Lachnospiraceae bacterium]